jgi:hypothetical protein
MTYTIVAGIYVVDLFFWLIAGALSRQGMVEKEGFSLTTELSHLYSAKMSNFFCTTVQLALSGTRYPVSVTTLNAVTTGSHRHYSPLYVVARFTEVSYLQSVQGKGVEKSLRHVFFKIDFHEYLKKIFEE